MLFCFHFFVFLYGTVLCMCFSSMSVACWSLCYLFLNKLFNHNDRILCSNEENSTFSLNRETWQREWSISNMMTHVGRRMNNADIRKWRRSCKVTKSAANRLRLWSLYNNIATIFRCSWFPWAFLIITGYYIYSIQASGTVYLLIYGVHGCFLAPQVCNVHGSFLSTHLCNWSSISVRDFKYSRSRTGKVIFFPADITTVWRHKRWWERCFSITAVVERCSIRSWLRRWKGSSKRLWKVQIFNICWRRRYSTGSCEWR